jgi:hypothetical protein
MPSYQRLHCAAVLLGLFSSPSHAQEALQRWNFVPARESGLVFIIDGGVEVFDLSAVASNNRLTLLDAAKWTPGIPFAKQYRMAPGQYEIQFKADPIAGISVYVQEGALTFIRLSPYQPKGVQISGWTGPTPADVTRSLIEASDRKLDNVFATPHIAPATNTLFVNTSPPWPIPPQRPVLRPNPPPAPSAPEERK